MPKSVILALLVVCSACAGSDSTEGEPSGPRASDASGAASAKSSDAGNASSAKAVDAGSASSDKPADKLDGGTAATFSAIYSLLFPATTPARCNSCHGMPASQVSNGKLHMGATQDAAYAALIDQASISMDCAGMVLVKPGQPEASLLYLKGLDPPPCGSRMPLGGARLTAAQNELVRSWIAAGAKND